MGNKELTQTHSDFDRAIAFVIRRRILLISLIVLGGVSGTGVSYLFPPQFRADALLIPADESLNLNEKGVLGSLGGIASLVGGSSTGNKENESIETLKSRALTAAYIEQYNLLPILFAKRWDAAAGKWKVGQFSSMPTLEDGYTVFDKNVRIVSENHKTGLVTLSITWTDANLSKRWAEGLIEAVNDKLRSQAIDQSSRNIAYLQKASDATSVMEIKTTIYKLMESEINKQMVAIGNKDYAFRIVDPPFAPEHKVSPIRSLFLLLGALLFPLVWCGFVLLKGTIARATVD